METLAVVSVIALLLTVLLPSIGSARGQMKQVKCSSDLRGPALEFQFFAEGQSELGRGDSERLGRGRFHINDFQESLYRIDEFWDSPDAAIGELRSGDHPILCVAGPDRLTKRRGFPCGSEAVSPAEHVSIGVNMRLYRAAVRLGQVSVLAPVAATRVRSSVVNHPYVPLLMDVDGAEAASRGVEPFYTAPPVRGRHDPYAGGRYWFPSGRHGGRVNVAFVGGHVLSSEQPERESWNWDYQANVE